MKTKQCRNTSSTRSLSELLVIKCLVLIFPLFLTLIFACNKPDCEKLSHNYESYEQAQQIIKKTHFRFEEAINTSKSSWITGASFHSCDGKMGYFMLKTSSKDYIFEDMPIEIWEGFKNSESFGKYYHKYIKGRYKFELKK